MSRVVGRYGRLDLLLLDELGYVQIDPRGAELLFQIITEREERASIGIAANLPFSEWGTPDKPDPRFAVPGHPDLIWPTPFVTCFELAHHFREGKIDGNAVRARLDKMLEHLTRRWKKKKK